jgi:hypothetical protein
MIILSSDLRLCANTSDRSVPRAIWRRAAVKAYVHPDQATVIWRISQTGELYDEIKRVGSEHGNNHTRIACNNGWSVDEWMDRGPPASIILLADGC